MSEEIRCFKCGDALAYLSLPISRRDTCRACSAPVHVCRMCVHFASDVPGQCREEDAEDVKEKDMINFCEWFVPSPDRFDADGAIEASAARSALDALFGDAAPDETSTNEIAAAEDLFK